jgi:hypothetical protein
LIRAYVDGDLSARILTDFASSSSSAPSESNLVDCEGRPWRRIRFSSTPFAHSALPPATKITVALESASGNQLFGYVDANGYLGASFNLMTTATSPASVALRAETYSSDLLQEFGYRITIVRNNNTDPAADARPLALFLTAVKFRERRGSDVCNQFVTAASIVAGVMLVGFVVLTVRWVREKMAAAAQPPGHVLGGGEGGGGGGSEGVGGGIGSLGRDGSARARGRDGIGSSGKGAPSDGSASIKRQGEYELGRMHDDSAADDDHDI